MTYTIYHNPRCSKSRQTLQILHDFEVNPNVVLYLDTPPTEAELKEIAQLLDMRPIEFIRTQEDEFKALLTKKGMTSHQAKDPEKGLADNELFKYMTEYPKIIERPIVVKKDDSGKAIAAVLGRPPLNVRDLLV